MLLSLLSGILIELPDKDKFAGREIFSFLLPKNLNLTYKANYKEDAKVIIENGEVKSGMIDKCGIGSEKGMIINKLVRIVDSEVVKDFIDNCGRLGAAYITMRGFSFGLSDLDLPPDVKKEIRKELDSVENEAKNFVEGSYLLDLEDAKKKIVGLVKVVEKELKPEIDKEKLAVKEVQTRLKEKQRVESELLNEVKNFFKVNNISVAEEKVIRKNTEADYVVEVPSQLGSLKYFVKVRKKKKLNEGDLSLAYNKGQKMKLPVLYLSTGELTKKARKYMEENMKGYLLFKQL